MSDVNLEQLNDENPWLTRRKYVKLAAVVAGGLLLSNCGRHRHTLQALEGEVPSADAAPVDETLRHGADAYALAERKHDAYPPVLPPPKERPKFYYPGEMLTKIVTSKNFMVLTLDDGPDAVHCLAIANTLKRRGYESKAGYVQVSNNALTYPWVTKELHDRGYLIMNHTKTHSTYTGQGEAAEIAPAQEDFYKLIGEYPNHFRAAGGTVHSAITAELARLDMCYWWTDGDEEDWKSPRKSPEYINGRFDHYKHPGYISLRHSGGTHDNTVASMDGMLDIMEQAGLTLMHPEEALSLREDGFNIARRTQNTQRFDRQIPDITTADGPIGYDLAADFAAHLTGN